MNEDIYADSCSECGGSNCDKLYCADCVKEMIDKAVKDAEERTRQILVEGWKGKDSLNIVKVDTEWRITEHRKDKETGEVAQNTHVIPELNVANVWMIIQGRASIVGEKTKYREVVADLILKNNLSLGIEEFNGGKNRSKYLFPLYYYPVKILEHQGFIKYGGRGTIVRLK